MSKPSSVCRLCQPLQRDDATAEKLRQNLLDDEYRQEYAEAAGQTDLASLLADLEARAAVAFRSIDSLREAKVPAPAEAASTEAARPFVPAEAKAALERLQTALGDFDLSAASAALSDLGGVAMPGGAAADLARLRNHVDGYEYEEAGALATRLLEQIGEAVP